MVVGAYLTAVVTTAVRASVAFRPAVVALEEGQRGPGAVRRLRDVRRVREVALDGLRRAVVHVVRHEGGVAVVDFVGRQMLRMMWHTGRVVMDDFVDVVSLHSRQTDCLTLLGGSMDPTTRHQHC